MMKRNRILKITGKTALFIDAANMFYSQKTIGFRVDYKKLYKYLEKTFNVKFAYYYTGFDPNNKKQVKFLDKLETFGYKTFRKPIKKINSKGIVLDKANVDVELALDCVLNLKKFNNFILASGDSDFSYLLKVLKKEDKRVFVISARGHIAKELIVEAEKYISLESLKEEITLDKKSPRTRRGKFS